MAQLGVGAMLHHLGGGSENSVEKYKGRMIMEAYFNEKDNAFEITFNDNLKIIITDEGQSCCESRYMTCDDDTKFMTGAKLLDIIVKKIDEKEEDYDCHEIAFLEVQTDKGSATFCTHVEHNGYYGGFGLNIFEDKKLVLPEKM